MKRIIVAVLCIVICSLAFAGCGCEHVWRDATCDKAKICELCGKTESTSLGHSWMKATCEQPQTCEVCQKVMGEALGHSLSGEVTCTTGVRCKQCFKIIEAPLGHQWQEATLKAPKTCSVCGETQGEPLRAIDVFPEGESRYDGTAFLMTWEQFIELFDEYLNRGKETYTPSTELLDRETAANERIFRILNENAPDQQMRITFDPETSRVTHIVVELGEDALDTDEAAAEYMYYASAAYYVANGVTPIQEFAQNMQANNMMFNGVSVSSDCLDGVFYRMEVGYRYMTLKIWLDAQ